MSKSESGQYDQLDRLAEEFAGRFRRGERPTIEEYTENYPELADAIRELFPAMVRVERADDARQGEEKSADPRATNPPPSQVGDYRILRRLGRGGMGVVYEAEQISLGRRVALKVLPGPMSGDRMMLERFRREARAAARLHHTNIVPVYEVGQDGDVRFYAMQFIQGQGLDLVVDELRRLRDRSPSRTTAFGDPSPRHPPEPSRRGIDDSTVGEAVEVGAVVRSILTGQFDAEGRRAEALGAAPSRSAMDLAADATTPTQTASATLGAIPEDPPAPALSSSASPTSSSAILPGGTQLSSVESGHRKFYRSLAQIGRQVAGGLAYAHARGIVHRDIKPSNLLLDTDGVVWITDFGLAKGDDEGLTQSGDVVGTLRYLAPERFRGQADARADIYALGLTMYELLTLRPGFDSADRLKTVEQIKTGEPPKPRSVDARIPRDLETIVLKAIEKDPKARYQTAEALSEDLRRFLADEPIRARPVSAAEHYWRWARRNPAIAVLGGILTVVLALATVTSFIAAIYFNRTARSERAARHEADLSREAESLQRQRAEREKKRADITLADAYTSRGLLAGERNAPAEAVLWFAAAAGQSAGAGDLRRQEDNRLRARNWLRQAILPLAAMTASGNASRLDFQSQGDLLLVRLDTGQLIVWSWRDDRRLPWADPLAGVDSAQFSPDGGSVALGFGSGEVEIRNVTSGDILARIKHEGNVTALAFSPDGKLLAIASRMARIWDASRRAFLEPVWSHPRQIRALAFNRNGDRLITACDDKLARVFAMEGTGDRRAPLFPPVVHVVPSTPALVDGDRILVTVSGESELRRWDMATGKPVKELIQSRASALQGVVASPDGNWFATGGYYGPELYAADLRQPSVYLGHTNLVRRFAFSPDNTLLLSAGMDSTARLWSVPDGRPLCAPLAHMAILEQCAWSHDSRYVATAEADGLIRVWERPVDGLVIAREYGWGQRPRVSLDGRLVVPGIWHETAVAGAHQNVNRVRVVGTADGKAVGADISLPGDLVDSCVCTDNLAVAAVWSGGKQGQLGVWDVATARGRFEPITLPGLPLSVAARPRSRQLAVICSSGDLLVIDDRTGKSVLNLRHEAWKESEKSVQVQYSPDGKTLVSLSGGNPATVNVRDAESGQLRFAPLNSTLPGSNFHSFSLSADSRFIATMSLVKNAAQVWDLATGQPLSEPLPHPGDYWGLFSVRFSLDGRYLLTSHKDGQNRCWDWRAAKLVCPPMANDDETHDVAITPDGRFALSVMSGRPELHVWELTTGRRVAPPVRVGSVEGGWCHTLAITPDGRRALVGYSEPTGITDSSLAVVDLEALLSPPGTATADLSLLSELATARQIELGDLSGLTTDQWQERWDLLHQRSPGLPTSVHETKQRTTP